MAALDCRGGGQDLTEEKPSYMSMYYSCLNLCIVAGLAVEIAHIGQEHQPADRPLHFALLISHLMAVLNFRGVSQGASSHARGQGSQSPRRAETPSVPRLISHTAATPPYR